MGLMHVGQLGGSTGHEQMGRSGDAVRLRDSTWVSSEDVGDAGALGFRNGIQTIPSGASVRLISHETIWQSNVDGRTRIPGELGTSSVTDR